MRYGIISDVHSNLTALEAVIKELEGLGVDRFLCPGDVVGYGPDPSECISRIRSLDAAVVLGNHDAAVCGLLDIDWFNPFAREAVLWTRHRISENDVKWLSMLPLSCDLETWVVVHSSLAQPEMFPYVHSLSTAKACFEQMANWKACFIGHSHISEVYVWQEGARGIDRISLRDGGELQLKEGYRYILNCGSVGQPRDGNPHAACALFDTEEMTFHLLRVPYDIAEVQMRMREADLPDVLIERLEYGL
ncbi:MAG: metallophosphoesterase family protein [Armatimonadota bacterium]|nr:metallophosphoesterase family protein [Armatimonadota bacterium]